MSPKGAAKRPKPKRDTGERQPRGTGNARKTAVVTGVTGQDGSYLAELLLEKGYEVIGVVRRTSHDSYERIGHLLERVHIVAADLLDQHSLTTVIRDARPDEVYNLAAQSFVPTSWNQPVLTGEFTALGVTRLLEAIRLAHPEARFYQASSSEMFGKAVETPQRYSVQPRVAAPRPRVRDAQSERRGRAHQARENQRAAPRQSRFRAGLGLCGRLRRRDVAHAAAARAERLRGRHRHDAHCARLVCRGVQPRGSRLAEIRESRSPIRASRRGGHAARRCEPGPEGPGMDAQGELRPTGENDGGCGRGAAGVKVLVTGANGFVGKSVVRRLLADGNRVV